MPFGYDTSNHGEGMNRFGYTGGQRAIGALLRLAGVVGGTFLGGPLAGKVGGVLAGKASNAWNNAHNPYANFTPGPLSQEGPLSLPGFSPGRFALSPLAMQQNGYQTLPVTPFQPLDPNSLHVTPITDVRTGGHADRGSAPNFNSSIGLGYNRQIVGGARDGWGVTRGPNYK